MTQKVLPLIAMLLVSAASLSLAQPMRGMGDGPRQRIIEELKLTDAQRKEVEKLRMDFAKQMVQHRAKVQSARIELQELFNSDSPDRSAIEKKINEIAQLGAQGGIARFNHWTAINKLLTPEQQKVWKRALHADELGRQFHRMRPFFRERMERRMEMRRPAEDFPPRRGW